MTHALLRILSRPKQFCWWLVGIGTITPVIMGLVVKAYLMKQGVATVPLIQYVYFLPLLLFFAVPYAIFALFAYIVLPKPEHRIDAAYWKLVTIIIFGEIFGLVATAYLYWIIWQPHGELGMILAPISIGAAMALGVFAGLITVKVAKIPGWENSNAALLGDLATAESIRRHKQLRLLLMITMLIFVLFYINFLLFLLCLVLWGGFEYFLSKKK